MRTFTSKIDDIDQFICSVVNDDYHADYIQLSAGPLNFQTRIVELPGITMHWNHFGARMQITESYIGDKLVFGVVFQKDKPFLFQGHEFPANNGAVQHAGTEQSYVIPEGLASMMIHVDRSLIIDAGLQLCSTVEQSIPIPSLKALVKECRSATQAAQQLSADTNNKMIEKILSKKILDRLLVALQPWSIDNYSNRDDEFPAGRDYLLVREAENEMMKIGLATRPSMDQLAGILEVSRRTLFYAFDNWLGMGPNTYFEIMRLHYVRNRLLEGEPPGTRVTQVANEFGFSHLSRFAGRYYEFFGEHPSETLARDLI